MIAPSSVDKVLQASIIEEVIGDYLTLKKRGANYMANCPFHDEKTPSFTVSPAKGIFKCFGCGEAGNSALFLMKHDHISFPESIRYLAKKYNIEIEETQTGNREEIAEKQKEREGLYDALSFANKQYQSILNTNDDGKLIGKSYFKERGYTEQTIQKFELGYSLKQRDFLLTELQNNQYDKEIFVKAGLLRKYEDGNYLDMFRDRVMFPIHDVTGRVIAFAGRKLNNENVKSPKYINSPETPVYDKSNTLYGLFQAKNSIKKENKVYLTEGYTDVITLVQADVENVVASSGTSLTEGHIRLLKRFTSNVTLLYDSDEAGQKAAIRGAKMLIPKNIIVRIVSFPEGEDPDSYCAKLNSEEFKEFLKTDEKDFINFKIDEFSYKNITDPGKKTEAIGEIIDLIAIVPDTLRRQLYLDYLAEKSEFSKDNLLLETGRIQRKNKKEEVKKTDRNLSKLAIESQIKPDIKSFDNKAQEESVIKCLLEFGHLVYDEEDEEKVSEFIISEFESDDWMKFEDPILKDIFLEVLDNEQNKKGIELIDYINHPKPAISEFAANIASTTYKLSKAWEKNEILVKKPNDNYIEEVDRVILHFKLRKANVIIHALKEKLKSVDINIEEDLNNLMIDIQKYEQFKKAISDVLGVIIL